MLDILEDYMVLRQLTYLRLDGSSNIEDRRDMVKWSATPNPIRPSFASSPPPALGGSGSI